MIDPMDMEGQSDFFSEGLLADLLPSRTPDPIEFRHPTTPDKYTLFSWPVKGTPKAHQVRALNEAGEKDGHCQFVDPGGGKTFITIAEAGKLWIDGHIDGVLILAPNRPHRQWVEEQFPLWCDIPFHATHNQEPPGRLRNWMDRARKGRALGVLAVNYEALRTVKGQRLIDQFIEKYPRLMLVADESQKLKNWQAARTHSAMYWARRSVFCRILTGTPLLKGLEDLWSQYEVAKSGLGWEAEPTRIINERRREVHMFGYLGYRTHYCHTKVPENNPRGLMILGYRNQSHLHARVAPYVTRVLSSEFAVMEAPDIISAPVEMSREQSRHYHSMKEDLVAALRTETITAQNALVQMGKLLQIANGFLYKDPEGREIRDWETFSTTKIDRACEMLEMLDEPVIVWSPFQAQQQMFRRTIEERNRARCWQPRNLYDANGVEGWKKDPTGILHGNQASGLGVGMNLQWAAANIYLANTYSSEARWQSLKRTDRMGQARQVRVWDLISDDTLETRVMRKLERNAQLARENVDVFAPAYRHVLEGGSERETLDNIREVLG